MTSSGKWLLQAMPSPAARFSAPGPISTSATHSLPEPDTTAAAAAAAIIDPAASCRTPTKRSAPGCDICCEMACNSGASLPPTMPKAKGTPSAASRRTRVWAPVSFSMADGPVWPGGWEAVVAMIGARARAGAASLFSAKAGGLDQRGPALQIGLDHRGKLRPAGWASAGHW